MRIALLLGLLALVPTSGCVSADDDPALASEMATSSRHELALYEGRALARGTGIDATFDAEGGRVVLSPTSAPASWTTGSIELRPFNELLLSWNVDTPPGCGFCVELRVGCDDTTSPWLYVGDWGELPEGVERTTEFDGGKIDVDYFRSKETYVRAQIRVRAWRASAAAEPIVLHRFATCASAPVEERREAPPADAQPTRLPVPFRSQQAESPEIAGRICSPTSVSMVLAYHGVDEPTAEVAARIYDRSHDIYGNWTRAVQGAWSYGVPGFLTRIDDWRVVQRFIELDQPLVISLAAKEGQLSGAPYKSTNGHLIVLCGFDQNGDVEVNDPAVPDPAAGRRVYRRAELEEVWMGRGGTSYVLMKPGSR